MYCEYNSIIGKIKEQKHITKGCITAQTNLILSITGLGNKAFKTV